MSFWNFSKQRVDAGSSIADKRCFSDEMDNNIVTIIGGTIEEFHKHLQAQIDIMKKRGDTEKNTWAKEIAVIKKYTREQAIRELIKSENIAGKIQQIDSFVRGLQV